MKILAISGSKRKDRDTTTLLNKALERAASQGAETEIGLIPPNDNPSGQ